MLDIRGEEVNIGDKVLITQFKEIKLLDFYKETEITFIFKNATSKVIIPKYHESWNIALRRRIRDDISKLPYKQVLKVDDNFIL